MAGWKLLQLSCKDIWFESQSGVMSLVIFSCQGSENKEFHNQYLKYISTFNSPIHSKPQQSMKPSSPCTLLSLLILLWSSGLSLRWSPIVLSLSLSLCLFLSLNLVLVCILSVTFTFHGCLVLAVL